MAGPSHISLERPLSKVFLCFAVPSIFGLYLSNGPVVMLSQCDDDCVEI